MFTVMYVFRVSQTKVEAFLKVQKSAEQIYKQYGALDDETFAPADLSAKYGCASFVNEFADSDEQTHVGLSRFRDRAHHDDVMAQVDNDERIEKLYAEMLTIIDMSRTLRGEFERVD